MHPILTVLPARLASTRLPGKLLLDLGSKTVLERAWHQAMLAGLGRVVVAGDDVKTETLCKQIGAEYVATDPALPSGTDRCAAAAKAIGFTDGYLINAQADEPFLLPGQLAQLAGLLQAGAAIATLAHPILEQDQLDDPNAVKVVLADTGNALYFSRYAIPFIRGVPPVGLQHYKHIGLYGFDVATLQKLITRPVSSLEAAESLEQLRWLQAGYAIRVGITQTPTRGIDTAQDLAAARIWIAEHER